MGTNRNTNLLFNWVFIGNLLLLALNDHCFKWNFPNWLTGKISDFSGMLIFPLFIQFLFPKLKPLATVIYCGLFFIFWKLPISESFINFYNRYTFIPITRTIDYSDLVALTVLTLSYLFIKNADDYRIFNEKAVNPLYLLIPSCFIFIATSPPLSYYMKPGGDIHIGKSYKMNLSKEVILQRLKEEGFMVKRDTSTGNVVGLAHYVIENVNLNEGKNKIKSIEIGFKGRFLLVNNICLSENFKESDWKNLKRYAKHYRKLIQSEIIEEVK